MNISSYSIQWNRTFPHIYDQKFSTRLPRPRGKGVFSANGVRKTGYPYAEEII